MKMMISRSDGYVPKKGDFMEIWKNVPGYEGIYEASNYGRVRSCAWQWGQKTLKPRTCKKGSGDRVNLWKNGEPRTLLVSRVIAATFHNNLLNTSMTVNHKDGNRQNNNADNLEWMTLANNIQHGFENGLYKQKAVTLTCFETGNSQNFRSMSLASRNLGRRNQYISGCLKKQRNATSTNGKSYKISLLP